MMKDRFTIFRRGTGIWLALILLGFSGGILRGQISVDLKLDRKIYIAHEPITGKLTVVNRAGRDLIFGNINGRNWLDFTVTDSKGQLISPARRAEGPRPVMIASGQSHQVDVVINQVYPMGSIGTYRVKASVSFPQINRVFQTKTHLVQVAEGNPLWSQVVGVPDGYQGAGTYRIFQLLTYYHGSRQKALYFRLKKNDTGRALKTYSVGNYLGVIPPKYGVDRANQLHVLFMTAPQAYFYTVIDVEGTVVTREKYFEKNGSRPTLVTSEFGEIGLRGGMTEEEANTPYERREFRMISERPPGMPRL